MEISLFTDLKPTGHILPFDEGLDEIPHTSRRRNKNPLDGEVVIQFVPDGQEYVYFLPKTGKTVVTDQYLYEGKEVSEQFGTHAGNVYRAEHNVNSCMRDFVYGMVLGERLVYRRFQMTVFCWKNGVYNYACGISPVKEVCRYVFHSGGVSIENRDGSMVFTTADRIVGEEVYDTLQDADDAVKLDLYRSFLHNVRVSHKNDIIRALPYVKKQYPKLGFKAFLEIYTKAVEKKELPENIPKRILRELNCRTHVSNTAVRIERDLVVVTGEQECEFLDRREQTRAYFDKQNAYYFRENAVTGEWQTDDLCGNIARIRETRNRVIDKDVFENTCMEQYAGYSVVRSFPRIQKINWAYLLAQIGFLSAEQAAKIESPIFGIIMQNIYEGKLKDGNKSLAELLGITGAQIKFLKDIRMPDDLESFAECMTAEDFIAHFPDVKKRIFAVSFYLDRYNYWNTKGELTKEEVFRAAGTLNALERLSGSKRDRLLTEYKDYLRMYRFYENHLKHLPETHPLRQEIEAFGEMPANMKPSKIRDYHNKIGRAVDVLQNTDQIVKYTAAIERRKEEEAKKTEYTDGRYSILMPRDAGEIIREGRELQHCVGRAGYIGAMAAKRCTILFLRDNRDLETPFITIEEREGSIRQCYGFRDSYNHSAEIRDFIKEYASYRDLQIEAVIYAEQL